MSFISLHTALPSRQGEYETTYSGYRRMPVEMGEGGPMLRALFPLPVATSPDRIAFIAFGPAETGDGEIFMAMGIEPHLSMREGGKAPNVCIPYPEGLAAVPRTLHQLICMGVMRAGDLHPVLFAALNGALDEVGIPILRITREGVTKIDAKMSQLLKNWAAPPVEN